MKVSTQVAISTAALLLTGSVAWMAVAQDKPTTAQLIAELQSKSDALARQAQLLHDEKEIERLQRIFGYYMDKKLWDHVGDLFAEDGTFEVGQNGVYVGKARVRHALDQFGTPPGLKEGELFNHMQLQPVIHVAEDGLTAKGRWRGFNQAGEFGKRAIWGEGVAENEYVKQDGVWKIKKFHFMNSFSTPYEKGWAKEVLPSSRPIPKGYEPDRPPSFLYQGFPKYFVVPFHYPNPVTGQPPTIGVARSGAQGEQK